MRVFYGLSVLLWSVIPLDFLLVAFSSKLLDILLAVPLLRLTLLFKYFDGLIKRLYSCPFHLDFLQADAVCYSVSITKFLSGLKVVCYSLVTFECILHKDGRTLCSSLGTAGGTRRVSSPRLRCCLLSPPDPIRRFTTQSCC